jgi:hypothetical protein
MMLKIVRVNVNSDEMGRERVAEAAGRVVLEMGEYGLGGEGGEVERVVRVPRPVYRAVHLIEEVVGLLK